MKKNEVFKIGDCMIKIVKVEKSFLTLEITGRENGFKTVFKISKDSFRKLSAAVKNAECITSTTSTTIIKGVRVKHREYTRMGRETDFTYKYDSSDNAIIKVVSVGGYCIITLYDHRVFRTVSFNIASHWNTINRMAKAIAEAYMYEF